MSTLKNWKTGISQAYFCHTTEEVQQKAFEPCIDNKNEPICWFDKMLIDGIKVQENPERPLTFLLSGPPGGGKSTLALELCYRLANNLIKDKMEGDGIELNETAKKCFYISTESTSTQVLDKVDTFKWKNSKDVFKKCSDPKSGNLKNNQSTVSVFGVDEKLIIEPEESRLVKAVQSLKKSLTLHPESSVEKEGETVTKNIDGKSPSEGMKNLSKSTDLVVVDSLNSLSSDDLKEDLFNDFLHQMKGGIGVVIFILDSNTDDGAHKFWEYICDGVIRIDSEVQNGYWNRTIEIKKARYQQHVQGKQLFKICPGATGDSEVLPRHAHPYRLEGGLFIYPSMHYYLSGNKRKSNNSKPLDNRYASTYPFSLNDLVKTHIGLIPEGRCTAFIGDRGGHKSHLGYLHLLYRMIRKRESSLVVSLRDDEEMTRYSMVKILVQEDYLFNLAVDEFKKYITFDKIKNYKPFIANSDTTKEEIKEELDLKKEIASEIIKYFEENGRFEILYFHPGYISPEEFCHRMLISVRHIKKDGAELNENLPASQNWQKVTVLFNSLDQLPSRFPLCAVQDIFLSGIIDSLNDEKVTSIFIAVKTKELDDIQYGLIPMSDLIVSFESMKSDFKKYIEMIPSRIKDNLEYELKAKYEDIDLWEKYEKENGIKWWKQNGEDVENEVRLLKKDIEKLTSLQVDHNDESLNALVDKILKESNLTNNICESIKIEVKRFAGGEMAGAKGALELISSEKHPLHKLFENQGLKFFQYSNTDDGKHLNN